MARNCTIFSNESFGLTGLFFVDLLLYFLHFLYYFIHGVNKEIKKWNIKNKTKNEYLDK
jgi:hypothetical protein